MKKILLIIPGLLICFLTFSQNEEVKKEYEYPAFETSILIDNQTVVTPFKGTYEFEIHHRFGKMSNGITDLYGVYAPSNIRMGFNYGLSKKSTSNYKAGLATSGMGAVAPRFEP